MRLADWVECDPPSDEIKAGLVQLCEHVILDLKGEPLGPVEYYVHPGYTFAMARTGNEWFIAEIDRRHGPDQRDGRDDSPERRDPDAALAAFVQQYGNGGSNGPS